MAPSISSSCAVSRKTRATSRFSIRMLWALLPKDISKHQRGDNRGVRLDDESRRGRLQFSPGDFFVRHRATVGAVRRRAVGNLAEVAPEPALLAKVLRDQRHDANWEVAGDPPRDLEEADRFAGRILAIPVNQRGHLLH